MSDTSIAMSPRPVPAPAIRDALDNPASEALNGPGSMSATSLLMQDAIPANLVSQATGHGKVALFANPYLAGKGEALIIDESGQLTYLQRVATETGWLQTPVIAGATITATEVVVLVHQRDLSIWAIYVGGPNGTLQALRLVPTTVDGVTTCAWQAEPDVISYTNTAAPLGLSFLTVYYAGRTPVIAATDTNDVSLVVVEARTVGSRFLCSRYPAPIVSPPETVNPPVSGLAAGIILDNAEGNVPFCFVATATILNLHIPARGRTPIRSIATDVRQVVGVYPSPLRADFGCAYIDTTGALVTWNTGLGFEDVRTRVPLGLVTGAAWRDVNEMLHIYGIDADDTLVVLHQVDWGKNGEPIWSSARVVPAKIIPPVPSHYERTNKLARPKAPAASVVATCVGLTPNVAGFALDSFPNDLPAALVRLAGTADPDEQFSVFTQDVTTRRWTRDKVRLPSGGKPGLVTHYVTEVSVLDKRGTAMPLLPVRVYAETLAEIRVDGASYLVGPGHSATLLTNPSGRISISVPADSLLPTTLHIDAAGLEQGAVVQPAAAVHDYLAGTGTLPSQNGLFTADALRAAKVGDTPVVDPLHAGTVEHTVNSTKAVLAIADGKPLTSRLSTSDGPAPRVHGFAVGFAPAHLRANAADLQGYTEFADPGQLRAHLDTIRALPEYGGIWDDFVDWAGDVWEGIKNGVIAVYEVVVDTVAQVFIWIGDKIVELVGLVIDTVESAVRAVEAVLMQVVKSIDLVVDWLKALFNFVDIWDSKLALEQGVNRVLQYGVATVAHLGEVASGWFVAQEEEVKDYFRRLKEEYRGRPLGDAGNQLPVITDGSGHGIDIGTMTANPQASWLLNQTLSGPVQAAWASMELDDLDSPILVAFERFLNALSDSGLGNKAGHILRDIATLIATIIDPADPAGASKASMVALLDIVEELVLAFLETMDFVVAAAVDLITTIGANLAEVLDIRLPGPLDALYGWLQEHNGRHEAPEPLTLGRLAFLIGGFAVTTIYKLVNGVDEKPFPGGVFPAIPAPPWHADYVPGALFDDPAFNDSMRKLQLASGAIGAFSTIVFDVPGDFSPVGLNTTGLLGVLFGLCSSVLSGGMFRAVSSCPPVSGRGWEDADLAWSTGFAFSTALAVSGVGIIAMKAAGKSDTGILKNYGEMKVGPFIVSICGVGAMTCFAKGIHLEQTNSYSAAATILATLPTVAQVFRAGLKPTELVRGSVITLINLGTGLAATIMRAAAAGNSKPYIDGTPLFPGTLNTQYTKTFVASGGDAVYNEPIKDWAVTKGALPLGLTLDPTTGVLSGTPTHHGDSTFSITCSNNFAPNQHAEPVEFTIHIN